MAAEAVTFTVTGMHCGSCGMLIDETLEDLAGVEQADTDARRGRTTVRADLTVTSVGEIVAAIEEAGYTAVQQPRLTSPAQARSQREGQPK